MIGRDKKNVVLKVEEISKNFGSVQALKDVTFELYDNEIVGLVGDNGAGKSTLIKIISGNFPPDKGNIYLEGKRLYLKSPSDARKNGIETVYQDLLVCNNLNSIANIFIGRELYRNILGIKILNKNKMNKIATSVFKEIGINMPSLNERVEYLSGGQRQAVALARFINWGQRLILLDEPTAALGVRETRIVLDLLTSVKKKRKVTQILISHNLQQVFEVVDRIIVLRHGEIMGIRDRKSTTPDEIVSLITGSIFVK